MCKSSVLLDDLGISDEVKVTSCWRYRACQNATSWIFAMAFGSFWLAGLWECLIWWFLNSWEYTQLSSSLYESFMVVIELVYPLYLSVIIPHYQPSTSENRMALHGAVSLGSPQLRIHGAQREFPSSARAQQLVRRGSKFAGFIGNHPSSLTNKNKLAVIFDDGQ